MAPVCRRDIASGGGLLRGGNACAAAGGSADGGGLEIGRDGAPGSVGKENDHAHCGPVKMGAGAHGGRAGLDRLSLGSGGQGGLERQCRWGGGESA